MNTVSEGFRMEAAPAHAASTDAALDRLFAIVEANSFGREKRLLASGRVSDFYFDMKPSMLVPEGAALIAALVFEQCASVAASLVGGLEMGAVPITGAVCLHSYNAGRPIGGFFVRKEAKKHGAQKLVEGLPPGTDLAGQRVVIVEDVTTTGASALKAVQALREEGAEIVLVVSIVDREEGAAQAFSEAGIAFEPLLKASRFLDEPR